MKGRDQATAPQLAAWFLLGQVDKWNEEEKLVLLDYVEEHVSGYADMDLDEADRLADTPQGNRDMCVIVLSHALQLSDTDALRNRPRVLARAWLEKSNVKTKKRPRITKETRRAEEQHQLTMNLSRLPACTLVQPPVFDYALRYQLRLDDNPFVQDKGLVVTVHQRIWSRIIELVSDVKRPVIELVSWNDKGTLLHRHYE